MTWHGRCATDGCDLNVYCRRVPADTPAPPPDTRNATPDQHRILEVPGYRDDPSPAEPAGDDDQRPAGAGADDDPGRAAAGDAEPATPPRKRRRKPAVGAAPAPPVAPTPPRVDDEPRGFAARIRARFAGGDDDDADESLFGVY